MEHRSERRRQLAAVWVADIVGYSRIAAENEDRAIRLVAGFQTDVREVVSLHDGRTVKFLGDGALAEFPSTESAALAALELCARCAPEIKLRVGLHVGEVLRTDDGDILGDGVNLAARHQAVAQAGMILCSDPAWRQLHHREGFQFADGGLHELKGQSAPMQTWELVSAPQRSDGGGATDGGTTKVTGSWRTAAQQDGARRKRIPELWAVALSVVALAVVFWQSNGIGRTEVPGGALTETLDATRLAVLYFDDHSQDQQLGYMAAGLTEALIHELTLVDRLEVISRNGVKPFRGGSVPVDSIARLLAVGSIVEGSVAQSGSRIRVTVQLIDGASGTHLASRVIEDDQGEVFSLQDRVVREVADALRRRLGEEIRLRELRHGTTSDEGYELVLRARRLRDEARRVRLDDMAASERILLRSDSMLVEASMHAPAWTEPHIERGWLKRVLAQNSGGAVGRPDSALLAAALESANEALRLDSTDAAALELRGTLNYDLVDVSSGAARESGLHAAEGDLRRAVRLDPSRAAAWWGLSRVHMDRGELAEAKASAAEALRTDAFLEEAAAVLHQVYYAGMQLGPTPDVREACEEGRRRFPREDEFISCQLFLLASFPGVAPDLGRGERLVDSLVAVVPRGNVEVFRSFGTMLLAQIAARAGLADSARALIHAARGDTIVPLLAYNEAHAHLILGERARALELLSVYLRSYPDTTMVSKDWWFEELRGDPAFAKMVGAGR